MIDDRPVLVDAPSAGKGFAKYKGKTKQPSLGIIHPGSLLAVGYNLHEGKRKRHDALDRAVNDYGYKETVDKLADLETINRAQNRKASNQARRDIKYLEEKYRGDNSPKA